MEYKVLDIANYIVNKSIDIKSPVTNLKLQKLLYYVQAAFCVEKGEPAFSESISAWKYGPVVEKVYYHFRRYVSEEITEKAFCDEIGSYNELKKVGGVQHRILDEDKEIINKVVLGYRDFTGTQLVKRTHEESPWLEVRNAGDLSDGNIVNDKIIDYFTGNKMRIYGGE